MVLKVDVKRLLKEYRRQRAEDEAPPTVFTDSVISVLEGFANWLDSLDIEKVVGK